MAGVVDEAELMIGEAYAVAAVGRITLLAAFGALLVACAPMALPTRTIANSNYRAIWRRSTERARAKFA